MLVAAVGADVALGDEEAEDTLVAESDHRQQQDAQDDLARSADLVLSAST